MDFVWPGKNHENIFSQNAAQIRLVNMAFHTLIFGYSHENNISQWNDYASCKHVRAMNTPYTPLLHSKTVVYRGIHYFCAKTEIVGTR